MCLVFGAWSERDEMRELGGVLDLIIERGHMRPFDIKIKH
jgi:hypothetical protein